MLKTNPYKTCPRCAGSMEEPCTYCNGKGEVPVKPTKPMKLSIESCRFVTLSDILGLIKNKKAKEIFINNLNNGTAAFGSNNRTLVTIEYVKEIMNQNNTAAYNNVRIALNEVVFSGVQYVDLEN